MLCRDADLAEKHRPCGVIDGLPLAIELACARLRSMGIDVHLLSGDRRAVAEEIVQEAFVKLWRKPPDAGEIAYPSWMRRVVTNLSINALQRTRRPPASSTVSRRPPT